MVSAWLYFLLGLSSLDTTFSTNVIFTNSFLVKFHENVNNDIARDIASRNGFESVGEVNII